MSPDPEHVVHKATLTRLDRLRPHPQNYREHPEDQLAHLAASLREHGVYRNVVVANDGTILAGHGVVLAARMIGLDRLPVIHLAIPPESVPAMKILAADNEIGHLAVIDDRALSEILRMISDADDLLGTGYDEAMLANLVFVTRPAAEVESFDAAAEWAGMPDYEPGASVARLVVQFDTPEERAEFMAKVGIETVHKQTNGTWSVWYPPRGREDLSSLRFEESA